MINFSSKLDPMRAKKCEHCGSLNVVVFKRMMENRNKEDRSVRWLVKVLCLDCEHLTGAMPHALFDMNSLPEKTHEQEYQWKVRERFDVYIAYINSDEWKKKVECWKRGANYRCERCGKTNCILQAHHITYDNFMHETKKDILILCTKCHEEIDKNRKKFIKTINLTERENFKKDLFDQ
jgi:phage terminase large subunit GpA-like protein